MFSERKVETLGDRQAYWRAAVFNRTTLQNVTVGPGKAAVTFARRKPLGGIGGVIFLGMIIAAILAGFIAPFDPLKQHLFQRYVEPGTENTGAEGGTFLLGTDNMGRDTLSRLLFGARISLYVSLVSVAIGSTAGAIVGIFSAFRGGTLDLILQRVIDAMLSFPGIILALGIMAMLGPSLRNVIIVLVIYFTPAATRIMRSAALSVKETVYVDAARAIGASEWRIMFRHIAPNCMATFIIFATMNLGIAIVVEASLSFLGVGSPPDLPTWGGTLAIAGQQQLEVSPWLLMFPCLAITIAVLGLNLLGDALRDVLDPRLRGT